MSLSNPKFALSALQSTANFGFGTLARRAALVARRLSSLVGRSLEKSEIEHLCRAHAIPHDGALRAAARDRENHSGSVGLLCAFSSELTELDAIADPKVRAHTSPNGTAAEACCLRLRLRAMQFVPVTACFLCSATARNAATRALPAAGRRTNRSSRPSTRLRQRCRSSLARGWR